MESHYEAELTPRHIHDFVYNIEYNEINPNSIFVKRLLVTMLKSFGRATMLQNNITLTKQQKKE
ncbi:TPA: arylamine N-acetyltransferase [Staphylococcus aureus]